MTSTRERNSALRIARSRGRAGNEAAARRWLEIASSFDAPSERQLRSVELAIEDGRTPFIHPGQLRLAASALTAAEEVTR